MINLPIEFGAHRYPYLAGWQCEAEIAEHVAGLGVRSALLVADEESFNCHGERLVAALRRRLPVEVVTLSRGEAKKRLSVIEAILESGVGSGITRDGCVIAFGGGVAGNVAGLAAALLFRGLPLVHIPTTFIAAFDSVLSFKQAVNLDAGKNLAGCFHPPTAVFADLAHLQSLPRRQLRSGLAEMVKNALAIDPSQIARLHSIFGRFEHWQYDDYTAMLEMSVAAKQQVMRDDPLEKRTALVLEYGHTVGHALEAITAGEITHGEGVAIGLVCAAEVSHALGILSAADLAAHRSTLDAAGLEWTVPEHISTEQIMRVIGFDNKRGYLPGRPGHVSMVLLERLGQPVVTSGLPLRLVPLPVLAAAIDKCRAHATGKGCNGTPCSCSHHHQGIAVGSQSVLT